MEWGRGSILKLDHKQRVLKKKQPNRTGNPTLYPMCLLSALDAWAGRGRAVDTYIHLNIAQQKSSYLILTMSSQKGSEVTAEHEIAPSV